MLEGVGVIFGRELVQYIIEKGLIRFLLNFHWVTAVRSRHVCQRASFRMQMAMP
jgi:hypothetical protein